MLRHAQSLDATELAKAGRHLVEVVDPDGLDRSLEAAPGTGGTRRPPGPVPVDRRGPGRWGPDPRPRHGRGRRPPHRSPAPPHPTRNPALDRRGRDRRTLHPAPRPPRPRRPPVGRPGHPRPTRPRHRPGPRLPRRPRPAPGHPRPPDPARQPRSQGCGHHRRRPDLPPDVIRRLACDAEVIPAVYGTRSEVLDVGRTHRLVTPALWTALVIRDRHCTFPTCTRPPVMCHAHHLTHWTDGGDHQPRQPRPPMRPPPPRHPPLPLGNTTQPRRPKTRIPPTTQTRYRTRMDPISTTTHVTAGPVGGRVCAS